MSVPLVSASGTQLCVISTEEVVATIPTAGEYVFCVDLSNLQSGDTVQLRVKTKCLTGGTLQTDFLQSFTGAQTEPNLIAFSSSVVNDLGVTCTIKQTAGTGRNFPWKVLQIQEWLAPGVAHGDQGGNNTSLVLSVTSGPALSATSTDASGGIAACIFTGVSYGMRVVGTGGAGFDAAGTTFGIVAAGADGSILLNDAATLIGDIVGNIIGAGNSSGPSGLPFAGVGVQSQLAPGVIHGDQGGQNTTLVLDGTNNDSPAFSCTGGTNNPAILAQGGPGSIHPLPHQAQPGILALAGTVGTPAAGDIVCGTVGGIFADIFGNVIGAGSGFGPSGLVFGGVGVQADIETILGTASAGAAGYIGIDWAQIANPTSTVGLTNTTIKSAGGGATPTEIWQDLLSSADFQVAGSIGQRLANVVPANVQEWNSHAVPTENVAGVPLVDVERFLGSLVTLDGSGLPYVDAANVTLSPANLQAIASEIMTAASSVETNYSLQATLRLILSILVGVCSGAGSGTLTFRDINNTTNRVVAQATGGNRTSITTNVI